MLQRRQEFFRFCVVGIIATLIDIIFFYILRQFFGYQVSMISGYVISLIFNYYLTILWTFNKRPSCKNALGVSIAHLFNLFVVRMSLMHLFVGILSLEDKTAYIPTLTISVFSNFLIIRYIVTKC